MARLYAKVVGVVVLLLGVVGLFAGSRLLGVINIEIVEDIVHLASGALLAYVGFSVTDGRMVRTVVLVVGVVYLLVGLLGFVAPNLFGLLPEHGYSVVDNLIHLVLGVLGIVAGRTVDEGARATA